MTDTQFQDIKDELKEMRTEMKPIIETFNTLRTFGKWSAVMVAFVGSLTALALGLKSLFKK